MWACIGKNKGKIKNLAKKVQYMYPAGHFLNFSHFYLTLSGTDCKY